MVLAPNAAMIARFATKCLNIGGYTTSTRIKAFLYNRLVMPIHGAVLSSKLVVIQNYIF